jgi:predicted AlkP superfamily pyrophosphatase or phosphodiesterase
MLQDCLSNPSPQNILGHISKEKKVILILVDGVRYDYVKDPSLKGFQRMARKGVKAEYVQPIFPSNSYPNWYTIVTGESIIFLSKQHIQIF